MNVRPYLPQDRSAVERICVEGGLRGNLDDYFCDRTLFAKLWLSPFLDGEPDGSWVVEQDGEVVGYLVAAIRPGFFARALRHMAPHAATMIGNVLRGAYRHHPASGRFVRWFLTRSWREVPKHARGSSNFHFNLREDARGENRYGEALMDAYFARLRELGHRHFHIHVFASAGKRDVKFYRQFGFEVQDVRLSSLFHQPTAVVSLGREIPLSARVVTHRTRSYRKVSVVIPAHNEANDLPHLLADLKRQVLPADEILVVADACTDATESIAEKAGARVVKGVFGHCGSARNAGVAAATGDILVLCDADSRVGIDFLARIVASVAQGYSCGGPALKADESQFPSWLFAVGQNACRRAIRCSYGTAYFATREMFARAGDYDTTLRWGEDVEISLRHRVLGRACLLSTQAILSCRRFRENGRTRELGRRLWRAICFTPTIVGRLWVAAQKLKADKRITT